MTKIRKRPQSHSDKPFSSEEENEELAEPIITNSRRSRTPIAQHALLFGWRMVTAILLMVWIYLSPNTPSGISCLLQDSNGASMGFLSESDIPLAKIVAH